VYAPTFDEALAALFGETKPAAGQPSAAPSPAAATAAAAAPAPDQQALIAEAAADLADYQRLTAEGKLGEAGQKLEALKRVLEQLNRQRR
jgi:uncharacterized membrane protein (UPF0182 family)